MTMVLLTRWVGKARCVSQVISQNTGTQLTATPHPCHHRQETTTTSQSRLDALHNDILFQILRWVLDPAALQAVFACSIKYRNLCDDEELLKVWLMTRTSTEVFGMMSKAVANDRHDQLLLLLTPCIRIKYSDRQLGLAFVQAMRVGHHVMMHQLLPFCKLSVCEQEENDLSRILCKNGLMNGFQRLTFKVVGVDDESGTMAFMTINAHLADADGMTGCISYFQCHSEFSASYHNQTKGITVLLGAPVRVSRVTVKQIYILNKKLIVTCAVCKQL